MATVGALGQRAGGAREARAGDSRSATTMANSPSVIRGRTARFIGLQNARRQGVGRERRRGSSPWAPAENYEGYPTVIDEIGLMQDLRAAGYRLASSQFGPTPMSTTKGTLSSRTFSMCS